MYQCLVNEIDFTNNVSKHLNLPQVREQNDPLLLLSANNLIKSHQISNFVIAGFVGVYK